MEDEGVDHKKQSDQGNIMITNKSTLSPTNDEKMRHARISSNVNNSTDECQSI
jgi:hypothetical protein